MVSFFYSFQTACGSSATCTKRHSNLKKTSAKSAVNTKNETKFEYLIIAHKTDDKKKTYIVKTLDIAL